MRTILSIFIVSFIFAMVLTPIVILVARRLNLMDDPSERKIHSTPIPRVGGIAIFLSCYIGLSACFFSGTLVTCIILQEPRILWLALGSLLIFGLGLIDDIWRLGYRAKFFFQILAGVIAYAGGLRIDLISFLPDHSLVHIGLSLPATVLWVVLVINAINLIDGLDGLAAGVGFLVCMVLLILCALGDRFVPAAVLAALAGALLGFLVFNSSPASIFMGDSGSYFIGFVIAAVSMMGSFKGQTAASILIPMIALGFPLMETIWSTLRRFIYGQKLFSPDRDHIHHRLVAMGLTQRRAVLILYGITVIMGWLSIAMVYTTDNKTALLLLLFGAGIIIGMRKLGYFDFFRGSSLLTWLGDVADETGLSFERRSFLNFQMAIQNSKDIEEMWKNLSKSLQWLKFDLVELRIDDKNNQNSRFLWWNKQRNEDSDDDWDSFLKRGTLMKMELPLTSNNNTYGTLWLVKDLKREPLSHYTIRRIEHLRRTVIKTIEKFV
ncbi:MAG: undecaprenyl/decaprenyl-phosphate alpha-N-acetylglucosaminyl 1-phosphate transferase [Desulfobacterales bacterium]|jgi:UDP-GlcNAc:undecaprenyl-phosphate GlcNAc-1-phosphate transferase|nr:undecaprenyl/decaprenyl-phosphate alpha-N-acetylglucosaminyl 1-phosphate transferase [Desulfobacterales bacterium]